ncbi:hypothetical protein LTR36_004103 [Oleoguttula mirabilis]|uniref:Carbohydrate kinase PfkB domain-containing protein n=1 Tax=Oleoguttula mirabilis TaxID=1507867 RepID=A0AAV9JI47_9PEZI|nr:hypothetical protein LTR36_004103 [Oleoguttula mirabilis]
MTTNNDSSSVDFVTLGMFIIDDIYPSPTAADQTPRKDVIGGAGTYSAIGARLFSPPPTSKSVGWIVDAGPDFPPELRTVIASWETGVLLRPRDAPTTRGWNGYGANEHRAFKYLTEKKRLTADDLTPELLGAKSIHLICSPMRCVDMVLQILHRRLASFGDDEAKPVVIWEPVPDLCTAEELENTMQALRYVDVISPNHEELGSLFSFTHSTGVDKTAVEKQAQTLLAHGIGPSGQGAVVVRAGKEGCYIAANHASASSPSSSLSHWLPAYHTNAARVVDPTGGGNGFLGGLAIGLVHTSGDLVEAARIGSIAASFCIEQVGMPKLTSHRQGDGDDEAAERWNGESVSERLADFRTKTR